ncbi:MAG: hypothetical protein LH480_13840 [Rubrivivax sp.]|nr:hypothetical protein [Rubrivivax sp.]
MELLTQALRGAQGPPRPAVAHGVPVHASLLLAGAGRTLGSALLAEALVAGQFQRVLALVTAPLASAVRGLEPLTQAALPGRLADRAGRAPVAVIVFERRRHSNGRDDAFVQPDVAEMLPLAQLLHAAGVRQLLVVVPHAPALLPQALAQGLATLDEAAVALLGFDQLVFVRAAQALPGVARGTRLQRFAAWWLSQLSWMVPQRQQPLRAAALAQCAVQLAQQMPAWPAGTHVIAPETLWQWTQQPQRMAGLPAGLQ